MSEDMPEAKASALEAMLAAVLARPATRQISIPTVRLVVDIAWRHQFDPENRAVARKELRLSLLPEVRRVQEANR